MHYEFEMKDGLDKTQNFEVFNISRLLVSPFIGVGLD